MAGDDSQVGRSSGSMSADEIGEELQTFDRDPRLSTDDSPSTLRQDEGAEEEEGAGKYVYCIVETQTRLDLGPLGIGDGGNPVYTVHYGDLAAVVSDTPLRLYDPTREDLQAHELVNESVMREHTVIPMAFGTIFRTDADVVELLRSTGTAFSDVLSTVRGKIELGLKVVWDREKVVAELEHDDQAIRGLKEESTNAARGSTYFARMQLGRLVEAALEARANELVASIYDTLRPLSVASRSDKLIGDNMILNVAYLVERSREEEFAEAVKNLSQRYQNLMSFKYTGPWPPIIPDSSLFVLRDITNLKHTTHEIEPQVGRSLAAEHQARRESERMNVIIENAGVPILVTDRQTNVVLMNREAERLLEVTWSGSRASPQAHDIRANDAKLAGFINEFLLQPRLRREGRLALVDPDEAREFPVLAVSRKILDDHHEPTSVVTVLHDLTQEVENQRLANKLQSLNAELEARVAAATHELERRNTQLERQSTDLERASLLKTEFLATMSHELRTPINAVLGYNSLLREGLFGKLTEKQDDALKRMRGAAEHLLSLINDILDLASVESGKIHVSAADIDLGAFLERLSESVRPMAAQKSLDYVLDVDPSLPPIRTDGTRLRQVLLNLLSNAVKFTDAGTVTVRAAPFTRGDRICLEVIDTGIGISQENIEKIFEEFTQVDQSVTREHGGTGLGLTISRKLIRIMGGRLSVSSTLGLGSTFRVELPRVPPVAWGDSGSGDTRPSPEPDPQSVA